ncbi:hypothetical protein F5Y13DRAFT_167213 [Hypoxylon sp. FL1857]|nr:hypothetical protein F5Y13DRAFT_167213 [Hypoxylon sp. FL1857]
MKIFPLLGILASPTLATAKGVINFYQELGCRGLALSQAYEPPANGTGECLRHSFWSVSADSDPGYIFTVYMHRGCMGRSVPLRSGACFSGNWEDFSYGAFYSTLEAEQ